MGNTNLDKTLNLIERSVLVSRKWSIYEIDISYSCSHLFEFRIYRKGDAEEILMWVSFSLEDDEFEEKFNELDRVLSNLWEYGVMPVFYNYYLNNEDDKLG